MDGLCQILEVPRSGYYAWLKRDNLSMRKQRNQEMARELVRLHETYLALGLDRLYNMIKLIIPCSQGQVHRLIKRLNIHSVQKKSTRPPQTPTIIILLPRVLPTVNFT